MLSVHTPLKPLESEQITHWDPEITRLTATVHKHVVLTASTQAGVFSSLSNSSVFLSKDLFKINVTFKVITYVGRYSNKRNNCLTCIIKQPLGHCAVSAGFQLWLGSLQYKYGIHSTKQTVIIRSTHQQKKRYSYAGFVVVLSNILSTFFLTTNLWSSASDCWSLGHISNRDPPPQIGVSNLLHFRMIQATVLSATFLISFLRSAPRCNHSLSSGESFLTWVLLWSASVRTHRDRCVSAMSRQLKWPQGVSQH